MKEWGVPPEQALNVIKTVVHYIVSKKTPNDKGLIEMPFNKVLGLKYVKQEGTICSWGKPGFVEKLMVLGLYWNYECPYSYIAFNDLSNSDLSPVKYLSDGPGYKKGDIAHKSHQKGTQVDFGIMVLDPKKNQYTNICHVSTDYDNGYYYSWFGKNGISAFFRMANSIYPGQFTDAIWCDSTVSSLVHYSNEVTRWAHANHIHMGY